MQKKVASPDVIADAVPLPRKNPMAMSSRKHVLKFHS